ncbi:hypothetical protein JCM8097_009534 [Rhodosporidiobolus ruineniae]
MAAPTPRIVVHWLDDSRAQRVLWLLEELGLEYEVQRYHRDAATNLGPPELRKIHPLGKSPVVTITEGDRTTTLAESGAIVEFLIERYGKGKLAITAEADLEARSNYLYWLHYAEGSAMLPLMFNIVFAQIPKQAPWLVRPIVSQISAGAMQQFILPRLKSHFGFLEQSLEGKDFLVGNKLTGADIMCSFLAEGLAASPLKQEDYPNVKRWHAALEAREAYKAAEVKGGKNDLTRFVK